MSNIKFILNDYILSQSLIPFITIMTISLLIIIITILLINKTLKRSELNEKN